MKRSMTGHVMTKTRTSWRTAEALSSRREFISLMTRAGVLAAVIPGISGVFGKAEALTETSRMWRAMGTLMEVRIPDLPGPEAVQAIGHVRKLVEELEAAITERTKAIMIAHTLGKHARSHVMRCPVLTLVDRRYWHANGTKSPRDRVARQMLRPDARPDADDIPAAGGSTNRDDVTRARCHRVDDGRGHRPVVRLGGDPSVPTESSTSSLSRGTPASSNMTMLSMLASRASGRR